MNAWWSLLKFTSVLLIASERLEISLKFQLVLSTFDSFIDLLCIFYNFDGEVSLKSPSNEATPQLILRETYCKGIEPSFSCSFRHLKAAVKKLNWKIIVTSNYTRKKFCIKDMNFVIELGRRFGDAPAIRPIKMLKIKIK